MFWCRIVQGFPTKSAKNLAPGRGAIYRKMIPQQPEFEDFYLPFGGRLRSDNHWVRLSKLIPWEGIEKEDARKQYRDLLVIGEVYRQQEQMYESGTKRIEDRIVSISQPHVRPIVRGKAGRPVEFGAKISVSLVDGYSFIERMSWDNFNESKDLTGQIEGYRRRFGYYPESVHADKIYRSRENLRYCERHGIRLSGPKLGRPRKEIGREEKKQIRRDELVRNAIEGKFGQGKRRFRLACIRGKLPETSGSMIAMIFLVMNLEKILKELFLRFLWEWILSGLYRYQKPFTYTIAE